MGRYLSREFQIWPIALIWMAVSYIARTSASLPLRSTLRPLLRSRRQMTTQAALSVAVKGFPETQVLGDCPFCHRVLLTMETKKLDYDKIYIDFKNKPQWLLDANPEGTVPVLIDEGKYIPDSGAVVDYLEEKYPEPEVPSDPEGSEAVSGIFGAFRAFFLNKDPSQEESMKEALHTELLKLEERLKAISGPLLGGDTFNAADALILPRLYHMRVALGHYKQWSVPSDCSHVSQYMEAAAETEVWKRCLYAPELIIEGWGAKL